MAWHQGFKIQIGEDYFPMEYTTNEAQSKEFEGVPPGQGTCEWSHDVQRH